MTGLTEFMRSRPALSIVLWAGVVALLVPVLRQFFGPDAPDHDQLGPLSATAFGFAGALQTFLVITAMGVERQMRPDAPLWRLRYAVVFGVNWFLFVVLCGFEVLPSSGAAILLCCAVLVYGGATAFFMKHDQMQNAAALFDTERPLWRTRAGDAFLSASGFVVLAVAGWAVMFAPDMAWALFVLILLTPLMLPFGLRNASRWREREVLVLLAVAALLGGLLLARP